MKNLLKFEILALFVLFVMVGDWNILKGMSRVMHDLARDGGATLMTLVLYCGMAALLSNEDFSFTCNDGYTTEDLREYCKNLVEEIMERI